MEYLQTDYIEVMDDFLSPEICKAIIERYSRDPRRARNDSQTRKSKEYRDAYTLNISKLDDWKDLDAELFKAVHAAIQKYCEKHKVLTEMQDVGYMVSDFDPGHVTSYHTDALHGRSALRLLSIVCYLNDLERGGETVFPHQNRVVKPKAGRAVLFPPFYTHRHYSNPCPDDRRYIMVTFVTSNPLDVVPDAIRFHKGEIADFNVDE